MTGLERQEEVAGSCSRDTARQRAGSAGTVAQTRGAARGEGGGLGLAGVAARVFQFHDGPRVAVTDETRLCSLVRHRGEHSLLARTENKDRKLTNQEDRGAKQSGDALQRYPWRCGFKNCLCACRRPRNQILRLNKMYGIAKPRHLLHREATTGDRHLSVRSAHVLCSQSPAACP